MALGTTRAPNSCRRLRGGSVVGRMAAEQLHEVELSRYDQPTLAGAIGVSLMPGMTITVNGARRAVHAHGDTPLLYVLRNDLELSGAQFGCVLSNYGACSAQVEAQEAHSWVATMI